MRFYKYLPVAIGLLALGASPAFANEPGTWTMYLGVSTVEPDGKGVSFTVPDIEFGEITAGFEIDSATSMPIGMTYMFNENWALDILAAAPFSHDIMATVAIPGESGTMKIGEFDQMPPTLSVQYHFTTAGNFDPYVGLGFNYTVFSDEKIVPSMVEEGIERISIDNSTGIAAQIGGHWEFNENWIIGFDARYIEIDADGTLSGWAFDPLEETSIDVDVPPIALDPWVYSLNVGYHFQ
jgi:outer membrane protein